MNTRTYLDNAATTPLDPEVFAAMLPYFQRKHGNASSLHEEGRQARKAVEDARRLIAEALSWDPEGIVFTSGATEADNLAIFGLARSRPDRRHIICSAIEHHAILHPCDWLEQQGYRITRIPVDTTGRVNPQSIADAIDDQTLLVSIMAGNNELGILEPIREIGELCRARSVLFHTDAVQAFGRVDLPTESTDLISLSAHKLHGPKGVGALAARPGMRLVPLVHGGGHERGVRSGTENVHGIVGFASACRLMVERRETLVERLSGFRKQLIDGVLRIPGTRLNGDRSGSLPHIANFSFAAIEGESLVMKLDERGIAASTGSACSSPNLEPSHVLQAIGVPIEMAHGSLRLSMGQQTTQADIDTLLRTLPGVVEDLRSISPFKLGDS
ncbi:cysteine desulfurase [Candidatus Bipolaricaulota bacterium]|nr:cysteine desulfurase [Candidatus Bipolaricaulota bacterium]